MNRKTCAAVFGVLLFSGCGIQPSKEASQLVVLYKERVASGNSLVSFVNHNDPTGQYALKHCEELREIYSSREKIPHICSTIMFADFRPRIK